MEENIKNNVREVVAEISSDPRMADFIKSLDLGKLLKDAIEEYPNRVKGQEVLQKKIREHKAYGVLRMTKADMIKLVSLITPDSLNIFSVNKFEYEAESNSFKLLFEAGNVLPFVDKKKKRMIMPYLMLFRIKENLDFMFSEMWKGYNPCQINNQIAVRELVNKYLNPAKQPQKNKI